MGIHVVLDEESIKKQCFERIAFLKSKCYHEERIIKNIMISKEITKFLESNYPLIRAWVEHNEAHRRQLAQDLIEANIPHEPVGFKEFVGQA